MIRRLRQWHSWAWVVLTPLLLVLLGAAWSVRSSYPESASSSPIAGEVLVNEAEWFQRSPISTRVYRLEDDVLILELNPQVALKKPDVLVYWLRGENLGSGTLLGSLRGTGPHAFSLPSLERGLGTVVLYSLGHQAEVDRATLNLEVGS